MIIMFRKDGFIDIDIFHESVQRGLNFKEAAKVMRRHGVTKKEFEIGTDDMFDNDNNTLHFGYLKGVFIFSERRDI